MNLIDNLSQYFKEFPGIGERQARRFVYFLLHKNPNYVKELGEAILEIKKNISQCPGCFLFFHNLKNQKFCEVCLDPKTDKSFVLVVEKDADYESIRKSRNYHGFYFILGGLVPIVTKETPNFVRIKELREVVEKKAKEKNLKEVILALSLNSQGEHTDSYLKEILSPLQKQYNFKIVSLGKGLSTGSELEYSDSETIKNAFKNRQ